MVAVVAVENLEVTEGEGREGAKEGAMEAFEVCRLRPCLRDSERRRWGVPVECPKQDNSDYLQVAAVDRNKQLRPMILAK